jgi:Leucine-rich repeat (LRR) protein
MSRPATRFVVVVLSSVLGLLSSVRAAEPLIPDTNLDAAIKANLPHHKGVLTDKALGDLYFLDANKKGIRSLAGLEKCPNLMEVRLAENQIVDLKPLAGLKNLQSLTLSKNQIKDLAPLRELTHLQYLELSDNAVSDLGPLSGLTALSALYVGGNQISDLGPVGNLTKLASLSAGRNQLKDIGPVVKLTRLVTVDLHDNQIVDVAPLVKLQTVGSLNLMKNRIADLAPLVEACKADAAGTKRFAPYLRLYLSGNPVLEDGGKKEQIEALKAVGVRLDAGAKP